MEVERQVDAVIDEFDQWFRTLGNDPLVGSERAAIKTFCWALLNGKLQTRLPEASERAAAPSGTTAI